MPLRTKTDFCDACYAPWTPRLLDEDGEPMDNICDDCAELMDEVPTGLREADERPPICACGVTMALEDDDDPESGYFCENPNCTYYGMEQSAT